MKALSLLSLLSLLWFAPMAARAMMHAPEANGSGAQQQAPHEEQRGVRPARQERQRHYRDSISVPVRSPRENQR